MLGRSLRIIDPKRCSNPMLEPVNALTDRSNPVMSHRGLRRQLLWRCLACVVLMAPSLDASAQSVSDHGQAFAGFSIYSGTGYQHSIVKVGDVRVRNTSIAMPSESYYNDGSFWITGLNYTHALGHNYTLGAQIEYFPISTQVSLSVSPGYAFNDRVMGYLKAGWAYVPTTVDQGPGRNNYKVNLNGAFAGVGVRALITPHIFGYAELTYARLQNLSFTSWVGPYPISGNASTEAYNVTVGLGYRF